MKKIISIILMCFMLSGCSIISKLNPFRSLDPSENTEKSSNYRYYQNKKEGIKIIEKNNNYIKNQEAETISQRLGGYISGISSFSLIIIVGLIILFPSLTIGILVNRLRVIGKALFQTVKGVQISKKNGGQYLTELAKSQDEESKLIINQMRAKF